MIITRGASARSGAFMKSGALGPLSDPAAERWQERVIRARKSIHALLFVSAAPLRGRRSRFFCLPRPAAPLTTFIAASVHRGSSAPLLLFPPVFAHCSTAVRRVHIHTTHLHLSSFNAFHSNRCTFCSQLLASTLLHPGHAAVIGPSPALLF